MTGLFSSVEQAISERNKSWEGNPLIPSWVDIDSVDLDQFFTRPHIAKKCFGILQDEMVADNAILDSYNWIEPAAGGCAFFNLLPEQQRIGIDVLPLQNNLVETDFLSWRPESIGRYAVIGNPPFGYRAWLALAFVNHSAKFADYVGMILPMAFQSDGKGSPKLRVEGLRLVRTEYLPQDSFTNAMGNPVKINALFQVWQRGVNNIHPVKTKSEWIDIFTVDYRKERLCGVERVHEANYFLQRTFYRDPPKLVKSFDQVLYTCGYGLVFKKKPSVLKKTLDGVDWQNYSNLAAHNCRHISMYHIYRALLDHGYV